ncbi:MAG: thioredoxin fold domain-containing protein [Gammaproteobacteria bacterium]|nr:thioredoxin fold domain-containing protein [Gammaproteobacteria bacterium]
MRKNLLTTLILSLVLSFASAQLFAKEGKVVGGKMSVHPDWFKESFLDIGEDVMEASDEGKHVMLFMHLNGCPYCYKMVEENIKNAPYTDFIKQNFDVISLNIRGDREVALNEEVSLTEKELAERFKVMYTPTIVFLSPDNKVVARINGYRSVPDFKLVLNYVEEKAYEKQRLTQYVNDKKSGNYKFRDHPQLTQADNLQKLADKPLAVLLEDKGCLDCDKLHDGYLASPEVRNILKKYSFVRLDTLSEDKLIDIDGNETTAKAWADKLGISYRPAIILFDRHKEVARIQSMLYSYHFTELLRYVAERHYEKYPDDFYGWLDTRTAEILKAGKDVDFSR